MQPKLTLRGIYRYALANGLDILQWLTAPPGVDHVTLVETILDKSEEFEVVYTNPYTIMDRVKRINASHYDTFRRWAEALAIEYNPLENYDRYEDTLNTDSGTVKNTYTHESSTSGSTDAVANNSTDIVDTGSSEDTGKVSVYDSDTFHNKTQDLTTRSDHSVTTGSDHNVTDSSTRGSNEGQTLDDTDMQHSTVSHIHGNIGVTTNDQMLSSYLQTRRFNIYEEIAAIYIDELCIKVY